MFGFKFAGTSVAAGVVATALAFGLTLLALVYFIGPVSGSHVNPAVTIAIGLTLTVVHRIGIPITGTSVNPARSLGPALVVGGTALSQVWLFIVAPQVGGVLAAGLHRLLYAEEDIQLAAEARQPGQVADTAGS